MTSVGIAPSGKVLEHFDALCRAVASRGSGITLSELGLCHALARELEEPAADPVKVEQLERELGIGRALEKLEIPAAKQRMEWAKGGKDPSGKLPEGVGHGDVRDLEALEIPSAKERQREHAGTAPGRDGNTSGESPEVSQKIGHGDVRDIEEAEVQTSAKSDINEKGGRGRLSHVDGGREARGAVPTPDRPLQEVLL